METILLKGGNFLSFENEEEGNGIITLKRSSRETVGKVAQGRTFLEFNRVCSSSSVVSWSLASEGGEDVKWLKTSSPA